MQSGLETPVPVPFVDLVARRAIASARLHGEAAGGAIQGCRRRGRRGCGGGEAVVHEEADDDDDVLVTVDDSDEELR
jgi:hypothetical protein